jgi:osmotically-inducible protein OsmY
MYMRLTLQVWEGRVLVGGALADPAQRAEAIEMASKPEGVREVINEVQIVPPLEAQRWTRDRAVEINILSRLTLTRDIASINYSVEVTNGVVFLLGVAHDQAELDRVIAVIREIPNIRRIANHVLLRDDPRRFHAAPAERLPSATAAGQVRPARPRDEVPR